MKTAKISGDFGIIIRRSAVLEKKISVEELKLEFGASPSDETSDLIVFSPLFGMEAMELLSRKLVALGLIYFDDFFEYAGSSPEWCVVGFSLKLEKT